MGTFLFWFDISQSKSCPKTTSESRLPVGFRYVQRQTQVDRMRLSALAGMIAVLILGGVVLSAYAQAPPLMPLRAPYQPLRFEEDWSFLQDPARRADFWDPIKFISLGSD